MMSDLLARIGVALHGADWRAPLAADLVIEASAFDRGLSRDQWRELLELLQMRDTELAALEAELTVWLRSQN